MNLLQKLKVKRYCNTFHECKKNPEKCNYIVEWEDIENLINDLIK